MKLTVKILLANFALAGITALIYTFNSGVVSANDFMGWLGLSCLGISALNFVVSIILFIAGKPHLEWARGFLLSCGVLLLVGFTVCTTVFSYNMSGGK